MSTEWPHAGRLGSARVRIAPPSEEAEVRGQPQADTPGVGRTQGRRPPPLHITAQGEYVRRPRPGSGAPRGSSSSGGGAGRARAREAPAQPRQQPRPTASQQRGAVELGGARDRRSASRRTAPPLWQGGAGWHEAVAQGRQRGQEQPRGQASWQGAGWGSPDTRVRPQGQAAWQGAGWGEAEPDARGRGQSRAPWQGRGWGDTDSSARGQGRPHEQASWQGQSWWAGSPDTRTQNRPASWFDTSGRPRPASWFDANSIPRPAGWFDVAGRPQARSWFDATEHARAAGWFDPSGRPRPASWFDSQGIPRPAGWFDASGRPQDASWFDRSQGSGAGWFDRGAPMGEGWFGRGEAQGPAAWQGGHWLTRARGWGREAAREQPAGRPFWMQETGRARGAARLGESDRVPMEQSAAATIARGVVAVAGGIAEVVRRGQERRRSTGIEAGAPAGSTSEQVAFAYTPPPAAASLEPPEASASVGGGFAGAGEHRGPAPALNFPTPAAPRSGIRMRQLPDGRIVAVQSGQAIDRPIAGAPEAKEVLIEGLMAQAREDLQVWQQSHPGQPLLNLPPAAMKAFIPRRVFELAADPRAIAIRFVPGTGDNARRFFAVERTNTSLAGDPMHSRFANLLQTGVLRPYERPIFHAHIRRIGPNGNTHLLVENFTVHDELRMEGIAREFYSGTFREFAQEQNFRFITGFANPNRRYEKQLSPMEIYQRLGRQLYRDLAVGHPLRRMFDRLYASLGSNMEWLTYDALVPAQATVVRPDQDAAPEIETGLVWAAEDIGTPVTVTIAASPTPSSRPAPPGAGVRVRIRGDGTPEDIVEEQGATQAQVSTGTPMTRAAGAAPPGGPGGEPPPAAESPEGRGESRIAVVILREFINRIQRGELSGGTPLKFAEALARERGVSRSLILLVYRALEAEGWIERRGRQGSFIRSERGEGDPRITPVTTRLRVQIQSGILIPGSPLPGVKALAAQEHFDTSTAQVVYLILEAEGLVVGRSREMYGRAGGIYVSGGEAPEPVAVRAARLRRLPRSKGRGNTRQHSGQKRAAQVPEPREARQPRIRENRIVELLTAYLTQIRDGTLPAGTVLPAIPRFARQTGLSFEQANVFYEALRLGGWISFRRGYHGGSIIHSESKNEDALLHDLRIRILTGVLPVGGRLPSMSDLQAREGISSGTAQAIYTFLTGVGLVTMTTEGTFINAAPVAPEIVVDTEGMPSEIREIVRLAEELRGTALEVEVNRQNRLVLQFTEGILTHLDDPVNLDKVYLELTKDLSRDDPRLTAIAQQILDFKALYLFAQPHMTIDRATQLLRLAMGNSTEEVAEETGNNPAQVERNTRGAQTPYAFTADQYLSAAEISPQSKAARIYHILRSGLQIIEIDEFAAERSNKQIAYYLAATGMTQSAAAQKIGQSDSLVSGFITGTKRISSDSLVRLLVPVNNTLYVIMLLSSQRESVTLTAEDKKQLLEGPLPFEEHVEELNLYPYKITSTENNLVQRIKDMRDIGEIFQLVEKNPSPTVNRELGNKSITARELYRRGAGNIKAIINIKKGRSNPEDTTIIRFCRALGYDFYHPVTQEMLYKNWLRRQS